MAGAAPRTRDRRPGTAAGAEGRSGRWRSPLLAASLALLVVNGLHGLDHVRQGLGRLTSEVLVGGQLLLLLALIPIFLAFRRNRLAAPAAVAVGLWTAAAVAASHLAPHWSAFSDPYADNDLDALAWILMLGEIAAALALGAVGLWAMRGRGGGLAAGARSRDA